MRERKSLDDTLLAMARTFADSRSPCPGGSTGCVLASKEGRILACGYNGPPHGWDDSLDVCVRDKLGLHGGVGYEVCPCVHAEANAVAHAARHGVCVMGAVAYVTRPPCTGCCKVLVQAGVHEAVCPGEDGNLVFHDIEELLVAGMARARAHFGE